MQAKILDQSEENLWNEFIETHPLATIHQTPAWGHFQEKIPSRGKYWIVALFDNGKIVGGTLLIRHRLPKGYCWLYASRGPLLSDFHEAKIASSHFALLVEKIKEIAKEENAIFLRIDPPVAIEATVRVMLNSFQHLGFHEVSHGFQPEHTLILDLTKSEEELLAQMKPKGRYNIRLAEKKGVTVEQSVDIEEFYGLLKKTADRDKFAVHDENYYRAMFETLSRENLARLYLAKFNGEILAGAIVTYFKDTATYYFGASGNDHRELMAPYLLHWEIIKDAKNIICHPESCHPESCHPESCHPESCHPESCHPESCHPELVSGSHATITKYDFFGISPGNFAAQNFNSTVPSGKPHPWSGVTDFKRKFGGREISYTKPLEYPFKKNLYRLYRLYKKIK
ncbi:peptidoglycan bridge formation glycyltransferase FemA/FemB family protein [Candidatus Peregrinibacteria bacterium]|nr:peptidoglycan bridge formation glycyltransferase FemA/FemB family protein [Candidatus Peregrinibacteria bacterium]